MAEPAWWQRGIIYQIYPRSFGDLDGDGIGDLAGIAARLDHLVRLGVDALWLSPIYPSPMADFGYDVADYEGIDPIFGTLADFDALVAAAHARGLRVLLDFVPNHSSDRHPWFLESRTSRSAPRRRWYVWRDPAPGGGPPNNWLSHFGGGAWAWDQATGQYYLHSFLKEQPDLNWRNPEVRRAMYGALRFWLARGVDGFRVDVLWLLMKDALFRDNPPNPAWKPGDREHDRLLPLHDADQPETLDLVMEMRAVLDEYPDRVLIGEIYLPVERLVAYYGRDLKGAHLPFNFQLIGAAWNAANIARLVAEYEAALPAGAWPNWVLGNHDQHRIATRIGAAQARVAAMLLLTLRGTPTIYYGEELGLTDVPIPPEAVWDPAERNEPGLGLGRDPERTPMPWDGTPGAGFTTGTPWLPVGADRDVLNVAAEERDPASMLHLYRALTGLRRGSEALTLGALEGLRAEGEVLRYVRRGAGERLAVLLNLGHAPQSVAEVAGEVLLSTHGDRPGEAVPGTLPLRPAEGVVMRLAA
ncbi:alpha-amylase family glycosyl hydrolase [Roseomonas sp. NAR14]|uniref:Alpha-amylase family glycosyl hydrolase n=1 Tax=Roseomonas acroporae TaxID=2937791 RepID=A0A9X2BTT0_9PROT|nr:alpha-amylase family glycosyl hydrolase [Roseomonas acroporae]MCK8784948.1 alpha-amylase family glycosyl hydrolase [Roseomonas acroporae]